MLAVVAMPFVAIAVIVLMKISDNKPYQEIGQHCRYYTYDGKIYFLDRKYKRMRNVDSASFEILYPKNNNNPLHIHQIAARDKNHVYCGKDIIEGIDIKSAEYLDRKYFRDNKHVFYDTELIENADPKSFELVFYNFYYARDNKHCYYEGRILDNFDLPSLSPIVDDDGRIEEEYIKDKNNVYYKGQTLEKANPENFKKQDIADDQWSIDYGYDGNYYYFENNRIEKDNLHLLVADRGFGNHEIFYSGKEIYYYDINEKELIHFATRQDDTPFTQIDRGIFSDGYNIYYLWQEQVWVRGKNGPALKGKRTGISKLKDIKKSDFKYLKDIENKDSEQSGSIYEANDKQFFHPRYASGEKMWITEIISALWIYENGKRIDIPKDESIEIYVKEEKSVSTGVLLFVLIVAAPVFFGIWKMRNKH